jgi:hypothetical protein
LKTWRRTLFLFGASTLTACALVVGIEDHHLAPVDNARADGGGARPDGATAPSSIAWVQSTAARSKTVAFDQPVTAGNTIVVGIDVLPQSATPLSVTDSLHNRYSMLAGPHPVGGSIQLYVAAAFNVAGGPTTVIVTHSGTEYVDLYMHEYAGLAPVDAVDTIPASGTATNASPMARASVTVSAPNELLFAFVGAAFAGVDAGSSLSVRVSFMGNLTGDRVIEQPGTYEVTAGVTPSSYPWGILLSAFKGK